MSTISPTQTYAAVLCLLFVGTSQTGVCSISDCAKFLVIMLAWFRPVLCSPKSWNSHSMFWFDCNLCSHILLACYISQIGLPAEVFLSPLSLDFCCFIAFGYMLAIAAMKFPKQEGPCIRSIPSHSNHELDRSTTLSSPLWRRTNYIKLHGNAPPVSTCCVGFFLEQTW